MVRCKAHTANLLTLVGLIIGPIIFIAKTKGSMEAYLSIIQIPLTVTSSNPIKSTSLSGFFFLAVCGDPIVEFAKV